MAKKLRSINVNFWDDPYITELDPTEKLLFLYILTNSRANLIGVFEICLRKIAFETGIDKDMVSKLLDRFEGDKKLTRTEAWIIIHNFIKNQNYNPNMKKGAAAIYNDLPDPIKTIITAKNIKGFETIRNPLKGFETLRKVEGEGEGEGEREVETTDHTELTKYINPGLMDQKQKSERSNLMFKELIASRVWIEHLMKAAKLNTEAEAKIKIRNFMDDIVARELTNRPLSTIKNHATTWIRKNN